MEEILMRKPFDVELYKQNDRKARDTIIVHLMNNELYVRDNEDKYGPDLEVFTGYRVSHYVEVEVKQAWNTGHTFPFPTIQLPERKAKFINSRARKHTEFWILSKDLKFACIIADKVVMDSPLVEVSNKYVASGERFYQIPIENCNIIELDI